MKIMIEIEEDYYKIIKHDVEHGMDYNPYVLIANGTPLSKEEDCISREEAMKVVWPYVDGNLIADDIKNLPSVTPKGVTITDFADKCEECGKILNEKLQKTEVNLYEVELMLERLIEKDQDNPYIKKPITHALYLVWKWAEEYERSR